MKLYYKPGACSLAAHIVLNELGLSFDLERTDTDTGTTESGVDFRTINPNGYVPALELTPGDVITENPAVLQYLADLAPAAALAPAAGTRDRIRLQEVLNFLSSELHKSFSPFFSGKTLSQDARHSAIAQVHTRVASIENQLSDGRSHLLGTEFTVADAYAFVILNWAGFVDVSLADFPNTQDFVARVAARKATQIALVREGLLAVDSQS